MEHEILHGVKDQKADHPADRDTPAGQLSRRILSQALEQTADIVLITDQKGVIEYVNPAFERSTGYTFDEVLGKRPGLLRSGTHDKAFYDRLWSMIRKGLPFRGVVVNRRQDGSHYYEEKTITPLVDESGAISHYVSTGKDVTERAKAQEKLRELAYFDSLTELPNRHHLHQLLSRAVNQAERHGGEVAVLFLDLDRFKQINDAFGHAQGDCLLQKVARRLRTTLREEDTVGRSGGDEFVILIQHPRYPQDVARVAQKLLDGLAEPFALDGHDHQIDASIGISLYPDDQTTPDDLLKAADMAMYQAKARGGSGFRFFSRDMEAQVLERIELERNLRLAMARGELTNHYQPQFDLRTGRLAGAEALVRWIHPKLVMIGPDRFVPVAEETGDILAIGQLVLAEACQQMSAWKAGGLHLGRISVNLSPRQLAHPDIVTQVERLIDVHCVGVGTLVLELTESALMQDPEQAAKTLAGLKKLGVTLSIDDFGTGYSSLSHLRRFPLDCVKIDRSFVNDLPDDPTAVALVDTIIRMARNLKMSVIAEGVENEAQLLMLREMGCEGAQGYLLGRPMPGPELTDNLAGNASALIGALGV
ncbi:MAG: EAL domain-containing protein [Candidatus Thiodiazotropha taylori]